MIKKIRECIHVNFRMTKLLFQASPSYFIVKLFCTIWNAALFVFQTWFFKYIIDMVVYKNGSLENIIKYFLTYYLLWLFSNYISTWADYMYTLRRKNEISKYYKDFFYTASGKKRMENYRSRVYVNGLDNAAYQDGECLVSFSDRLLSLIYALFIFIFYFQIFCELNVLLVVLSLIMAVKNIVHKFKLNELDYLKYKTDMNYRYQNQYIRNIFYQRQYIKENHIYPVGYFFIEKYYKIRKATWNEKLKYEYKRDNYEIESEIIDSVIEVAVILILVYYLINNQITIGDFNLVFTNFLVVAGNIENIIGFFIGVYYDSEYMKDIFSIIDSEEFSYPDIAYKKNAANAIFENVSFSYAGEEDVLKDLTVKLPLDKKIAIVGENGSGKSTFIKLLLGLYAPSDGNIAYNYNDIGIADTSELFSIMLQDFRIFALTISENIALKKELDEEELCRLDEAVRFSGLEEKMNTLPDGLDTELTGEFSDSGTYLSGGETQKLAIARAYMMDRPVLILDEPSSNLDPVSENELIHRINQLTRNKGVILVTHNMSYAKNVDLVLVFHEGQIVECGAPDELRERKGYFYRMVEEQRKAEGGSVE